MPVINERSGLCLLHPTAAAGRMVDLTARPHTRVRRLEDLAPHSDVFSAQPATCRPSQEPWRPSPTLASFSSL